jgi:hypothetical protein
MGDHPAPPLAGYPLVAELRWVIRRGGELVGTGDLEGWVEYYARKARLMVALDQPEQAERAWELERSARERLTGPLVAR